jgi:hypothetical protein
LSKGTLTFVATQANKGLGSNYVALYLKNPKVGLNDTVGTLTSLKVYASATNSEIWVNQGASQINISAITGTTAKGTLNLKLSCLGTCGADSIATVTGTFDLKYPDYSNLSK